MNQKLVSPGKAPTVTQSRVTTRRKLASLRVISQRRRLQINGSRFSFNGRKNVQAAVR